MHKFNTFFVLYAFLISIPSHADSESMPSMPKIAVQKTYTIESKQAGEDLQEQRGFGDKEPEVKMMNLMMVEGSGYEGMDMNKMKMADSKNSNGKPDNMSGMSMPGMDMSGKHIEDKIPAKTNDQTVELTKSPSTPAIGPNTYEFKVKDKNGKELRNLNLKAQVYMLNMDMGTETPKVKELKPGIYQTKANFAMKGPWALKIMGLGVEKIFKIAVEK